MDVLSAFEQSRGFDFRKQYEVLLYKPFEQLCEEIIKTK